MANVTSVQNGGCYELRRAQGYSAFSLCRPIKYQIIKGNIMQKGVWPASSATVCFTKPYDNPIHSLGKKTKLFKWYASFVTDITCSVEAFRHRAGRMGGMQVIGGANIVLFYLPGISTCQCIAVPLGWMSKIVLFYLPGISTCQCIAVPLGWMSKIVLLVHQCTFKMDV